MSRVCWMHAALVLANVLCAVVLSYQIVSGAVPADAAHLLAPCLNWFVAGWCLALGFVTFMQEK